MTADILSPPNPDWLERALNPASGDALEDIFLTVDDILERIALVGPHGISFPAIDPARCSLPHLTCALRTCFAWKDDVAGWGQALASCERACALQGLDPGELLSGML